MFGPANLPIGANLGPLIEDTKFTIGALALRGNWAIWSNQTPYSKMLIPIRMNELRCIVIVFHVIIKWVAMINRIPREKHPRSGKAPPPSYEPI